MKYETQINSPHGPIFEEDNALSYRPPITTKPTQSNSDLDHVTPKGELKLPPILSQLDASIDSDKGGGTTKHS